MHVAGHGFALSTSRTGSTMPGRPCFAAIILLFILLQPGAINKKAPGYRRLLFYLFSTLILYHFNNLSCISLCIGDDQKIRSAFKMAGVNYGISFEAG